MNTIYLLIDPRTGLVRYVGVTAGPLNVRMRKHLHMARRGEDSHRSAWIRQLLELGVSPLPWVLELTLDRRRECFWIAHYRSAGIDLTNGTDGGDGLTNPSPELRQKIADSVRGFRHTAEARAKIRAAQLGRPKYQPSGWKKKHRLTSEQRAHIAAGRQRAIAEGRKGGWPEGVPRSPETIEKIRQAKRQRNKGDPHD